MTKALIVDVLRTSCQVSITTANAAADDLIHAIVAHIKRDGRFTLPRFGRFTVAQTKARVAMDPRTQEKIKVKARTTVRFKASPVLRATIGASRTRGAGRRAKASAGRQSSRESSPLGV
jgi:DNA-binding protein HU-beta